MNKVLASFLLALSTSLWAAPTLTADPVPNTGAQPSSVSITVNNMAGPTCVLIINPDNSKQPECDLAPLPIPSTNNIIMTYVYVAGCNNVPNTSAVCWEGGSKSGVPFSFARNPASVGPSGQRVKP